MAKKAGMTAKGSVQHRNSKNCFCFRNSLYNKEDGVSVSESGKATPCWPTRGLKASENREGCAGMLVPCILNVLMYSTVGQSAYSL